jgi:hypothetical protein
MITFNITTKRIELDVTSITCESIWKAWEDWSILSDNIKYGEIIKHTGGDSLGAGIYIPHYFFLQDDWRIKPMESNHNLYIIGNISAPNNESPIVPTTGNFNVLCQFTVPVQAQTINLSGANEGDSLNANDIANAVWAKNINNSSNNTAGKVLVSSKQAAENAFAVAAANL